MRSIVRAGVSEHGDLGFSGPMPRSACEGRNIASGTELIEAARKPDPATVAATVVQSARLHAAEAPR